jgi:hypothetical protein
MNLDELTSLITVRDYVANSLNNNSVDRKTLSELGGMLLLLDKKIFGLLKKDDFKKYIDFADVRQAIVDNRKITSGVFDEANKIKSGIK